MNARLFGEEAMAGRCASFLVAVHLQRPLGFAWASGGAIALGAALVALALWGTLHRKATVSGLLVPA